MTGSWCIGLAWAQELRAEAAAEQLRRSTQRQVQAAQRFQAYQRWSTIGQRISRIQLVWILLFVTDVSWCGYVMCDDVIPNGCWWIIIMVYGSSCWNDIKWPDWTLWVQALKSDAGSRGSPSPVHDSNGFSVQFNPLNNWISTEVLQHVWNDPFKCITVAAYCSRVVCSIFALVFQVLSIISQGSVASSPMQKVIDNGSAARKAGAHWMCPFWGRMTWMDMNGISFGRAFLFFHSCFYALNGCLGGCWGVQNGVSRMGRGAWRNSNWNWSKSRLTARPSLTPRPRLWQIQINSH